MILNHIAPVCNFAVVALVFVPYSSCLNPCLRLSLRPAVLAAPVLFWPTPILRVNTGSCQSVAVIQALNMLHSIFFLFSHSGYVQGALSARRRWTESSQENAQDLQWLTCAPERQEGRSNQNQNLQLLALRNTGEEGWITRGTGQHLNRVVRATRPNLLNSTYHDALV